MVTTSTKDCTGMKHTPGKVDSSMSPPAKKQKKKVQMVVSSSCGPPTLPSPNILYSMHSPRSHPHQETTSRFRGTIHSFSSCNNGDRSCELQVAFVSKHFDANQQFFLEHLRSDQNITEFLRFGEHNKVKDRQNLVMHITANVKCFRQYSDDQFQCTKYGNSFFLFVGKLNSDGINPTVTNADWARKLGLLLHDYLNNEVNNRYEVPRFDVEPSSVKYPLSAIFYKEELWNVLKLLWNVNDEDVFEQILNHSGSLEMIYGTSNTSEETKNDHRQKLLELQALFSDM